MHFLDVLSVWFGLNKSDSINRLIQLSVIQLSSGHCNTWFLWDLEEWDIVTECHVVKQGPKISQNNNVIYYLNGSLLYSR